MLKALHIENIAVIKTADIDFGSGFSALTGETGAGKSILVDSINLLLGARPQKDMVRTGESRAEVSALFSDISSSAAEQLGELGIYPDEEGTLYLSRTITQDGKSQTRLGGRTLPVSVLKQITALLVDIHGQHDSAVLLLPSAHIDYLDSFAGLNEEVAEYGTMYEAMTALKRRINAQKSDEKDKARNVEMLNYQINEIDQAKLKPGEEEALEEKRKRILNFEKIRKQSRLICRALYRSEKSLPAFELVKKAASALESISDYVPGAEDYIKRLNEISYELEDIGMTVEALNEDDTDDPSSELDRIEERLELIKKLSRKYGASVEEILKYRSEAGERLKEIELSDVTVKELTKQLDESARAAAEKAKSISAKRRDAAHQLAERLTEELKFLEMPKIRFMAEVSAARDEKGNNIFTPKGIDNVSFLMSANPGEPLKPIDRIASGGELSRIMLALKTVGREKDGCGTVIFDEIDTGVSGRAAQKIGLRLRQLGAETQVICVTHSAQVAAAANTQYLIEKKQVGERVQTDVRRLDEKERVSEIARIIGGINITENLTATAREMLDEYNDK